MKYVLDLSAAVTTKGQINVRTIDTQQNSVSLLFYFTSENSLDDAYW